MIKLNWEREMKILKQQISRKQILIPMGLIKGLTILRW